MKTQNTYSFRVELNGDGSGDATANFDRVLEDSYIYGVTATGASIPVAGTLVIAKTAKTGQPATTILSDAVVNAGIDITPYKLVQGADGADIAGEYNQTIVRRGDVLTATGSVLGAAGTLYVDVQMSNMPLPVTR
ncbi:MAG: hypothetical protein ACYTFK_13005 [Planctomycetota bacterium]|jgi:hypothetical protein